MAMTPEEKKKRKKERREAKKAGLIPSKKGKSLKKGSVKITCIHDTAININTTSITKETVKLEPGDTYEFIIENELDNVELSNLKRMKFIEVEEKEE